jgi:hypothetical protein
MRQLLVAVPRLPSFLLLAAALGLGACSSSGPTEEGVEDTGTGGRHSTGPESTDSGGDHVAEDAGSDGHSHETLPPGVDGGRDSAPVPPDATTPSALHPRSELPVGVLSQCNSDAWLGGMSGTTSGDGTVTLAEKDGIVTATLAGGNGYIASGTVKFQLVSNTAALALPGQSFTEEALDASAPTPVAAGSIVLVDGNLVVSLAGPSADEAVWFECVVPYAGCDYGAPDPAASFPASGTYDDCVPNGESGPDSTVTLTVSGGVVTAQLSTGLLGDVDTDTGPDGGFVSSVDFTIIAPGVAIHIPEDSKSGDTCGNRGSFASLTVEGSSLFLSGGTNWNAGIVTCTASGATASAPLDTDVDASVADGSVLAATESGRTVTACSECKDTEFCTASTFQGDECFRPEAAMDCMPGTMWDPGASCCVVDPITDYACWPLLPTCTTGLDCDCASGVVDLICGYDEAGCSVQGNVLSCEVEGP